MKTLLLFLGTYFVISFSFAQEVVGSVKRGPYLIAELSVKQNEGSQAYKLRFLDASTSILKSIEFSSTNDKIEELYTFLNKALQEKNGTSQDFEIENHKINVTTQKMVGLKNILLTINETHSFGLSANELNKLFNKK